MYMLDNACVADNDCGNQRTEKCNLGSGNKAVEHEMIKKRQ